jgi:hypothetical protein
MRTYNFWKENRQKGLFQLTFLEIKTKFIEWMKTKERSWMDYYYMNLFDVFVMAPDGLNSVMESEDLHELRNELNDVKKEFFKSVSL